MRLLKFIKVLGIGLPLLGAGLFFTGSMPANLFGADRLDIAGNAGVHGMPAEQALGQGWQHYGGDAGGHRYSAATQITAGNVDELDIAWQYSTGDLAARGELMQRAASEGTAILVEDSLVLCTPFNEVVALHPGTGQERWRFDSQINLQQRPANQFTCRGVAYWQGNESENTKESCRSRIFMGTNDARLIALDAGSGKPCEDFAERGELSIDIGMPLTWPGEYQITSPPVVVGDVVIVGAAIADNARVAAPNGAVRAFDARSGEAVWQYDPIPRDADDPGRESWPQKRPVEGHANAWAPMSVDHERGMVFLPTSSPSPDFYGGLRQGDNRNSNSIVALHAASGDVAWAFQTVHHDVWDYDLPAQPGLYSVWREGKKHDVVAQVTKTGFVFVLHRDSGEPFLPIDERAVQASDVPGEALSPTQPFPAVTPALIPQSLKADEAFGLTGLDRALCKKQIAAARSNGLFTPPSTQGTILMPFNGGGANWGGPAYDPNRNLLLINMSNMAHHIQLLAADEVEKAAEVFHDREVAPQTGAPYGIKREPLLSPLGLPCNPPPWGVLAAVDLDSGAVVWRTTLGTTEDLAPGTAFKLGTPNVGGPLVTAGGLVFIGAAMDNYLRAFDAANGKELWRGRLPAGGQATPMTYVWQGRQYVVIFAGGHARMGTTLGDSIVAFALPKND